MGVEYEMIVEESWGPDCVYHSLFQDLLYNIVSNIINHSFERKFRKQKLHTYLKKKKLPKAPVQLGLTKKCDNREARIIHKKMVSENFM